MGAKPKRAIKGAPAPGDEKLGLWVDTHLLSRHLKQPSQSFFDQVLPASADRLLHFADLALGSVKPDKFKSERVSKQRATNGRAAKL